MSQRDAALPGQVLLEISDEAIISVDRSLAVTAWNRGAERLYGYTADEITGRPIRTIIPGDYLHEAEASLQRLRAGETVRNLETVRLHRSGERISVILTIAPLRSADGRPDGAVAIHRPLSGIGTEPRAAQRLAAIVESSSDAIISKDLNGIVTSWNEAAERMFGYAAGEMVGSSIRQIIPDDRQTEEDEVLSRIRRGERVDHFETIRRRQDGTLVPISLTVSPVRDGDGRVVGASKIARDISERIRLQAEAREQAAITRRVGEVGAELASTLDRDRIVQKVTDAATRLTGAEIGAYFYNVQDPHAGDAFTPYTVAGAPRDVLAGLPPQRAATLFGPAFRGDGVVRLADVLTDPHFRANSPFRSMPAGDRPVRSYLAVPIKAGERMLGGLFFGHSLPGVFTELQEQLAAGIAAWASIALENAALYVEARDANRMKDEFLAVLSHELRTPLNAIVGYARLLRGGVLSGEKAERGLETLERNATVLTQIVEDVLDVSRITTGKLRLDVQPVELALVIHNAVATVQPAADAKAVRIQTIIDPGVTPVSGDPDRLQQVVWNLLTNAVKFTPKRGRVQVRLERVNSHVEIVVSDTGVGISPDFLPYVFDRFRQGEAGTTRRTGGLGLGLAIVRHIVEMHGGTVHAASLGEGQGATFRVQLPLMIVHPESFEGSREHPRTERFQPMAALGSLHGVRVLAVDDEFDALTLLRVVLESAGALVTTVSSASEALDRLRAESPDAMIVDLGMPEMDGCELIRQIRSAANPRIRDVPAAALTAFVRSEDRTRALRSGFEMHLAKPVDPMELVASVATLVRRSRTGAGHEG
ncbi:MAG TPA: PAS domain S-box protein [Vicinamibacterales bacterium]